MCLYCVDHKGADRKWHGIKVPGRNRVRGMVTRMWCAPTPLSKTPKCHILCFMCRENHVSKIMHANRSPCFTTHRWSDLFLPIWICTRLSNHPPEGGNVAVSSRSGTWLSSASPQPSSPWHLGRLGYLYRVILRLYWRYYTIRIKRTQMGLEGNNSNSDESLYLIRTYGFNTEHIRP